MAAAWRKCAPPTTSLSFKYLRKTGASMLAGSAFYPLRGTYLAHAPSSIADRHYCQVSQAGFDDALRWLGTELGLIDAE